MREIQLRLHCLFSNGPAPTEIYTLSLHDALPILRDHRRLYLKTENLQPIGAFKLRGAYNKIVGDRKSTRLNSSHVSSSYAVFCLKKKRAPSSPASLRAPSPA